MSPCRPRPLGRDAPGSHTALSCTSPLGDDPAPELADAEAVLGMLTPELLARAAPAVAAAPDRRAAAGVLLPDVVEHPVTVTNLRGLYGANVADHVMAFGLAFPDDRVRRAPHEGRLDQARHHPLSHAPTHDARSTSGSTGTTNSASTPPSTASHPSRGNTSTLKPHKPRPVRGEMPSPTKVLSQITSHDTHH
jgi:hypothetical protein